jgi:HAE1 family hydrophobic/amphiphilic exporter-1
VNHLLHHIIRRPVAVTMFFIAVLFTGFMSLYRLPLELVPSVDLPQLTVVTSWPDSSPESVEALVTSPVEAAATGVRNVRNIRSTSSEGESQVEIEFLRGTDMDFAALELNEKLSALYENLPVGVYQPKIQTYVPKEFQTGEFLSYHVMGNFTPSHLRQVALEKLKTPLLGVKGVSSVQVLGGQEPELRIEIDPAKLQASGLDESQVMQLYGNLNIRTGAGRIFREKQKIDLVIEMQIDSLAEIERTILANRKGKLIRLWDVATVQRTYPEPQSLTRINGKPAVMLQIEREAGTNMIKVADRVFQKIAEISANLPPLVQLIKRSDQSEQIRTELDDLSNRAILCILVIFIVLILFLHSLRIPFVILLSIFFSVLIAINFFWFAGISFNLLTLAGLALGFGMLVDNSIVVIDNIIRHYRNGSAPVEAGIIGTREVALPILAATLTTIVVFIPFLYLTGELRIYYWPFAQAVGLSLAASLLVAFTFIPTLTIRLLPSLNRYCPGKSDFQTPFVRRRRIPGVREYSEEFVQTLNKYSHENTSETPFSKIVKNRFNKFSDNYLHWVLHHKFGTILLTLLLFGVSYYLFDKYVSKGEIWNWNPRTYLRVSINCPAGSELSKTNEIIREFEKELVGHPEIKEVFTRVYSDFAYLTIYFPEAVELTSVPLVWKEHLIGMATGYAGVNVAVYGFGPGFSAGGGSSAPSFRVKVLGYNYNEVKKIAENLGRQLARNPRVREVDTNSSEWYGRNDLLEMVLRPDRQALKKIPVYRLRIVQPTAKSFKRTSKLLAAEF